jgi:hypothetical protein
MVKILVIWKWSIVDNLIIKYVLTVNRMHRNHFYHKVIR